MKARTELTDQQILDILQSLTLHEKAALCSGLDFWRTTPIPAKGIPSLRMADGPHGVRVEDPKHKKQNGGNSKPATCFPTEAAISCSWNPELTRQVGQAAAEEALHYGVGMVLGPGVNIKRSPLCGRNFEYYSEDPLLSGKLACGFIRGLQENGAAASIKHFAVNSQERLRMSVNAAVDDRALFDIYLRAFEIAVREAKPETVMCSYNQVNGAYASENRRLLTDILRLRFGFTGAVVSDWGAVNDRPAGIAAGLDLEMPTSGGAGDYAIENAVKSGFLPEDALDTACWNLLKLIFRRSREGATAPGCDWDAHHRLCADALTQSAVLLKNDGMLPLASGERIAVIGEMAEKPRYQGGGSSHINPTRLVGLLSALKAEGQKFVYAQGYSGSKTNEKLVAAAVAAAKTARQVVLVLGLPDSYECEGYDRRHLELPESQLVLLNAVTKANPEVCVVLCCGSPVQAASWLPRVKALLCPYLGGQAVGQAIAALLYGRANPSGKLTESWPMALEDVPCQKHFPMGPKEVTYNESIFVGYRYYETAQKPVLFPFGYGLSYTSFAYFSLQLSTDALQEDEALTASLTVENTGKVAGDEIVQLYLARKESATYQPAKELVAFTRVSLQPSESKTVQLKIPYARFSFYHAPSFGRVVEEGEVEILAGPNCQVLPLSAALAVRGKTLPRDEAGLAHYGAIKDNQFPHEGFAAIYSGKLLGNRQPRKGEYNHATPLGQMHDSATGKVLLALAHFVAKRVIHFSTDKEANARTAYESTRDLPFKNLMLNTAGLLSPRACAALLDMCNGRRGFGRFVAAMAAKKPYKKPPTP